MHGLHLQPVLFVELCNDDMRVGARAKGPDVCHVLAGVFDKLLQVSGVSRLIGDEWQMSCRHAGNEREILICVVRQILKDHAALRQSRGDADE